MELVSVFLFAVLVEAIITNVKQIIDDNFNWVKVTSLVLSIAISVAYQVDLFANAGFTSVVPYVGSVLTGIVISRGSNFVYEIITNLKTNREFNEIVQR